MVRWLARQLPSRRVPFKTTSGLIFASHFNGHNGLFLIEPYFCDLNHNIKLKRIHGLQERWENCLKLSDKDTCEKRERNKEE